MPISVSCSCGKTLSVKDELAGKRGKCPACGVMLTIPLPAKPAAKIPEPEEWGLVPLDDEKPAPKVTKPAVSPAKPQAGATAASGAIKPAPGKVPVAIPAPVKMPEPEEWGLVPLDDEKPALKETKSVAKELKPVKSVAPISGNAAKPQASAAPAASNKIKPLLAAKPAAPALSKPPVTLAKPPVTAAPANKPPLGGPVSALLDLPPPAGGELEPLPNHAAWLDEGAEADFNLAGPAATAATGTISTPSQFQRTTVCQEYEGTLVCPHCGDPLKRTFTVLNCFLQMMLGIIFRFLVVPATPVKCGRCGPVGYSELNGPSRRTLDNGRLGHGLAVIGITLGIIIGIPVLGFSMIMLISNFQDNSERNRIENDRAEHQKKIDEMMGKGRERPSSYPPVQSKTPPRPKSKQELEALKKKNEQHRRDFEERLNEAREKSKQPVTPRPNPVPSSTKPAPTPTPTPTPTKPVNPFEEITLPPSTPPKTPAPVNPFQPID